MNPLLVQLLLTLGGTLGASFIKNPQLQTGISTSIAAVNSLISGLAGQHGVTPQTFMAVYSAAITALKADPNLSQQTLSDLAEVQKAIQAALDADKTAQIVVYASSLKPVEPLP